MSDTKPAAPAKTAPPTRIVTPKKKEPAAVLSSKTIAAQTEAFLRAGGVIEQVKPGVSGQQNLPGPKHISLGSK